MIRALGIHFFGFALIDGLMQYRVKSADADLLSVWYACFALIDFIALMTLGRAQGLLHMVARCGLLVSLCWSVALAVEMALFQDLLQRADPSIQRYLDITLGATTILAVLKACAPARRSKQSPVRIKR